MYTQHFLLLDIKTYFIFQSDNGLEFVAKVITELVKAWPGTRIVRGRPRHPQSQGGVERGNQDLQNIMGT